MSARTKARVRVIAAAMQLAPLILACGLGEEPPEPHPPPPPEVAPVVIAPPPPVPPNVTNHEAPGNLAPSQPPLGCIEASAATSTMTPADLYPSMVACATADRADAALFVFALAGVYGRFDTFRVADRSAHGAATILRQQHVGSVPEAQWAAVSERQQALTNDPAQLEALCREIRRVGPPNYSPQYMIRHGMRMFTVNTDDPLVADFDADAGWARALDEYLHCPAVPAG